MINKLENIGFYTMYDDRCLNLSPTSQMKRGEIILLEKCNFSCPYCRGLDDGIYGNRKDKMLSFDEVKNIIDIWCKNSPIENIRFSGGEPTLHPNILDIVKYAKCKGIKRIALSTNGYSDRILYDKLIEYGVNDFSISLDACCSKDGDKMSGGVAGSWEKVTDNIKYISTKTYVTVGVVLTKFNIDKTVETIKFADSLGVSDIRIISSAQYNEIISGLNKIPNYILDKYPILKYRVDKFERGENVRGISETDTNKCPIVIDDVAIAGDNHYPCIIYMREKGNPIGKVCDNMRNDRIEWFKKHNSHNDPICKKNCIDACVEFNNKVMILNENIKKI